MKRKYEIVYIFDSALEEPEVNEHLDRFHELLKTPDQQEPITGLAHWGKRTLAYPIKKKEMGHYVVAHFETETALLSEFERIIKLDETVLRYLVVINEGLPATRIDQLDGDEPATGSGEAGEKVKDDSSPAADETTPAPAADETTPAPAADETTPAPAADGAAPAPTAEETPVTDADVPEPKATTDEGGE